MATVTGLTAERMLAIEAASVVDGAIDTEGHLILTKHDGTEIDAGNALVAVPDASDTQKGVVELATDAEIETGTSTTRAITPAGLSSVGIPQMKTDIDDIAEYVDYLDEQNLDIFTRLGDVEANQVFRLDPLDYMQSYLPFNYPDGLSVLFLTGSEATAGGWDFGGKMGVVRTFCLGADAHQTWMRIHTVGVIPEVWVRSGDATAWSAWRKVAFINDLPTTVVATGGHTLATIVGAGGGANVSVSFPAGRFSAAPRVTMSPTNSSRLNVSASSITSTGFIGRIDNFTTANASAQDFNWIAMRE